MKDTASRYTAKQNYRTPRQGISKRGGWKWC